METQEKLKGLIRKIVSPIIMAGSLTLPFVSTNSCADDRNDQKNLRD